MARRPNDFVLEAFRDRGVCETWLVHRLTLDLDRLRKSRWIDGPTYFRVTDAYGPAPHVLEVRSAGRVNGITTKNGVTYGHRGGGKPRVARTTLTPLDEDTQDLLDVDNTARIVIGVDLKDRWPVERSILDRILRFQRGRELKRLKDLPPPFQCPKDDQTFTSEEQFRMHYQDHLDGAPTPDAVVLRARGRAQSDVLPLDHPDREDWPGAADA